MQPGKALLIGGFAIEAAALLWLAYGPEDSSGSCAPESIGVVPATLAGAVGVVMAIFGLSRLMRSTVAVVLIGAVLVVLLVAGYMLGTFMDGWCF